MKQQKQKKNEPIHGDKKHARREEEDDDDDKHKHKYAESKC